MRSSPEILVVGAGLAGAEAAWQAARRGVRVILCEMRPVKMTPAHHTGLFAELVCSNSFRSDSLDNAAGLLKEEMRRLDSLIMRCAGAARVPAGKALAVDRHRFASLVTGELEDHPLVTVRREEILAPPDGLPVVVATGPLTSEALASRIRQWLGQDYLHFYDAAAPIVLAESLDMKKAFRASRYGRGEDYLNCPLSQAEYELFWDALVNAETARVHGFEPDTFFEGCLPVEELARRGKKTLLFGPMKPVGLVDPATGERPHGVVQLRQDDLAGRMYNMVGFQTRLKWGEQRRVFRMIPGMESAEFVRYGVMHRNTFLKSPVLLRPTLATVRRADLFFAGQITGVEGYLESTAMGLVAGTNAARTALGLEPIVFPPQTAHGALCRYITTACPDSFQPMKINFGLLPEAGPWRRGRRGDARSLQSRQALEALEEFKAAASL